MICKSLIYVKKKIYSECVPLKCRLIIEGIKSPQEIDLLADSQESTTLCAQSKSFNYESQQITHYICMFNAVFCIHCRAWPLVAANKVTMHA